MAPSDGFPLMSVQFLEPVMPNNSPFEHLLVFTIIFAAGALWSTCFGKYVEKVRKEAQHARPV
jgi:hypothetical protein